MHFIDLCYLSDPTCKTVVSFKTETGDTVHAYVMARWCASDSKVPVVLGSLTKGLPLNDGRIDNPIAVDRPVYAVTWVALEDLRLTKIVVSDLTPKSVLENISKNFPKTKVEHI